MSRWTMTVLASLCLLAPAGAQQPAGGLILLDVVATDGSGKPITDLRQEDFQISDEGKPVTIESFTAVNADGASPAAARSILVVLDDSGVPASGTNALRALAQNLLSRMGPADQIGIVKLHDPAEKIATEPQAAMEVIGGFVAGSVPFVLEETPEVALRGFASLAQSLESTPNRRKGVVCIGSALLCGITELAKGAPRNLYPLYLSAVSAAADANVAVYGIVPQNTRVVANTLSQITGGQLFITTSAFEQVFERIWSELSHYYLIGYRPQGSANDLPQIGVKVGRRGVQVRARARRGKAD
jgi:VWFA-related protein